MYRSRGSGVFIRKRRGPVRGLRGPARRVCRNAAMSDDTFRSVDSAVFANSPRAFFAKIASSAHPSLSYTEEFLWWSARLAGDATFNVRVVLRLRGPLRVAALEDSIVEIA